MNCFFEAYISRGNKNYLLINDSSRFSYIIDLRQEIINIQNTQSSFIHQRITKPCLYDVKQKLDKNYFFIICPLNTHIYNLQTLTLHNFLISNINNNAQIVDIQQIQDNIFLIIYDIKIEISIITSKKIELLKSQVELINPIIYHQRVKQLGQNQYQILLKGVSDVNGFTIACYADLKKSKSSSIVLEESKKIQIFQESENDGFKNCIIQQSEKRDTRRIKYQILYKSSQAIKVFDICNQSLFNEKTLIEYKAFTQNNMNSDIVLTLVDSNFVHSKFYNIKISSSNLFLGFLNSEEIHFNPEYKLTNFQLSQLNITTNQNTHFLYFENITNIIFNDINISDQNWESQFIMSDTSQLTIQNINLNNFNFSQRFSFMQISDVKTLYINNVTISNCYFAQQLFDMTNVQKVTIKNLKIIDTIFQTNMISIELTKILSVQDLIITYSSKQKREEQVQSISALFLTNIYSIKLENTQIINTQYIQLLRYSQVQELSQSLTIKNLTAENYHSNLPLVSIYYSYTVILNIIKLNHVQLQNTNLFEIFQTSIFQLQDLEASKVINHLNQVNQHNKLTSKNSENHFRLAQNEEQLIYIFLLRGIQTSSLNSLNITNLIDVGLVNLIAYSKQDQDTSQLLNRQFNLQNVRLQKILYYSQKLLLLNLQCFNSNIQKMHVTSIQSNYHIITINARDKFVIEESSFLNVDLENESIINIQQTQIVEIKQTTFENIHVININCGVVCINSAQDIKIIESAFINIQNQEAQDDKVIQKTGSGALFITDSIYIQIIESRFIKCQNYFYGGAVYLEQNQNVTFFNSSFTSNSAVLNSGGAIFAKQNVISFENCTFESNYANNEKGGAIYSQENTIKIFQCKLFNNKALIGGGIYTDLDSLIDIKQSQITNNFGLFYGDNLGSIPKFVKRVEQNNNTKIDYILINNFQSGNYTKDVIYVNFFDQENRMLDFLAIQNYIIKNKNTVSKKVESEYLSYFLKVQNDLEDEILISSGIQLLFDDLTGMFRFNINASYKNQKRYVLKVVSNINNLYITLIINFRDCIIGEIKQNRHGFIFCDECSQGTYSLVNPNTEALNQCKTCPAEAQFCRGNQIILRDGYWRENRMSDQIFQCIFQGCSEVKGNQFGCIQGFIGPMCQSCDNYGENWDHLYGVKGTYCYRCSNYAEVYIYLAVAIVVYILYIHFSLKSQIDEKSKLIKLNYLRKMNILFLSKSRQKGQDSAVLTKIFLNYLQIFSTSFDFFSRIPKIFESTIDIAGDPTNITVNSYDCLFKMSWIYPVWLNRILIQFFQIFVTFGIILAIQKCFSQRKQKKIYITIYLVFIYLFYYPSITKFLISLVFCEQIGSNSYLKNDYKQQCYSQQHKIYSLILIYPILIVWTIIIPGLLFIKMRKSKQQGKDQTISYILSYYILQQGFRTHFYYWEIVRMSKKFMIMLVINLSINDTNQRLIIAIICQIYFTLINKLNPISSLVFARCERLLIQVLIISLMLQCILYSSENMTLLQTIVIILFFLINAYGVAELAKAYLKLKKQKPPKIILKMSQYLIKYSFFKNYFKKQRVPLLRISQLWQQVYKNRKNLILMTQTKINTINRITSLNQLESIRHIDLNQIRPLQPITSKQMLNQDEVIQFSSMNMEDS
ncbi:transmembrane protein, putative (macronuclear) [Tetrahymena thermophila SB210]|uniref:Transmembrane protein, putative n=1 Tax=Tetrahymena thermophila (strain SB210) TaxID=312017 RepID=Q22UV0_TETTS|nr:transmembrane protein, putative [Tetrahymena thermophila SB210]EAR89026.3 transmembrane protein, putative [Tetrahymena thermophila SB210]|eukprot:XP_001009271.3 transmembrane protein, putative [Tetrahymena thermophila SB210]